MIRRPPHPVRRRSAVPVLHVVVPDRVAARSDFTDTATALRRACRGGLALHLRFRQTEARAQHALARRLRGEAERSGGWCVVNGRVDVALTAGSQAAQLGAGALSVTHAREVLGRGVPLGRSVHSVEEAVAAASGGADYLLTGTIYATPSHPDVTGAGPERVARCASRVEVPVVGIGGIDAGRAAEVVAAGAHGVAVIRAVWDAPDPVAAAREILEECRRGASASSGRGPTRDRRDGR